jgi:hypothetical protein
MGINVISTSLRGEIPTALGVLAIEIPRRTSE